MPTPEFRKEALEKLHSPEQLDKVIQLVPSKAWLFAVATVFMTVAFFVWAVFDKMPVTVNGVGIMLYNGTMLSAISQGKGVISDFVVNDGQQLKKGDLVASLEVPELKDQIAALEQEISLLQVAKASAVLLAEKREALRLLKDKYALASEIRSPMDGVVFEILLSESTEVDVGTPVAIISPKGDPRKDLVGNIFVNAADAKLIKSGMVAHLAPTSQRTEQYGYLVGDVDFVAVLPTDTVALLGILKVVNFADYIEKKVENPLLINVIPRRDPQRPSGYVWTSVGQHTGMQPGTVVDVNIIIAYRSPLEFVLPWLFNNNSNGQAA